MKPTSARPDGDSFTSPADGNSQAPSATTKSRFYRPELDALRFFAFLVVFMSHRIPDRPEVYEKWFHLPARISSILAHLALSGGFGVYLFFQLSAFLITVLLLREKEQFGKLHLREFYIRRILRIWPLYFFMLLVGGAFAYFFAQINFTSLPYFLFLLGNWAIIYVPNGFAAVLNPLWSISVEEQFYLLWPPIVARLSVTTIRSFALVLVAIPIPAILLGPGGLTYAVMNSFSAMSAMGLGILAACVLGDRTPKLPIPRGVVWVLGILVWFAASSVHIGESVTRSIVGIYLVDIGSALFLIGAIGVRPWRRFVELGKISYGLYVYHTLVISIFGLIFGVMITKPVPIILTTIGELAVTIAVAVLSYRWLETPFLRLKERFAYVKSRPVELDAG